jgi:hypothetical protein
MGASRLSMNLYETQKKIMSKNQTRRGGKRVALEGPATFKKPARYWQLRHTTSYPKARPGGTCRNRAAP